MRSLEDLRALPPLEKHEIQEHGADMIARNWPRADLIRNQTGGSTGTPVTFYLERRPQVFARGGDAAPQSLGRLGGRRQGGGRSGARRRTGRPTAGARVCRNALLREPMWLDAGCLTEERMAEFHQELHRFRPRIIQAYARAVVMFARFLQAAGFDGLSAAFHRHVRRNTGERRPAIAGTGVRLSRVYNRYGCREVSVHGQRMFRAQRAARHGRRAVP